MENQNWLLVFTAVAVPLVTLIATLYSNYRNKELEISRDEKKQESQQNYEKTLEADRWNREKDKAKTDKEELEKQNLVSTYQICLRTLFLLSAKELDGSRDFIIKGDKRIHLIEDAQKYLALLSLKSRGRKSDVNDENFYFARTLSNFISSPDGYVVEMQNEVQNLANRDKELPSYRDQKEEKKVESKTDEDEIIFSIYIDKDFRKNELKKGNIVSSSHGFSVKFTNLNEDQRALLVDTYFEQGSLSKNVQLKNPDGEYWQAESDPKTTEPKDFIEQWKNSYIEKQQNKG